jgi:hypothetical protein
MLLSSANENFPKGKIAAKCCTGLRGPQKNGINGQAQQGDE